MHAFQSPNKKYGISRDLLSLHSVNTAYSGLTFDESIPEKRYVREVNMDQSKKFSQDIQEVELPHSPIMIPSKLTLEETHLRDAIILKSPRLNKSSAETSIANYGKTGTNESLLPRPFSSTPNYYAREAHQYKLGNLFNTTIQNEVNEEINPVSVLDGRSMDRTQRIRDRYQASFLPSMDMYPRMSQVSPASSPRHYPALPEDGHIPMAHISDVYNNVTEHRKSGHNAAHIAESQYMAYSQKSYISKNTSPPFITTLHQLQESQPYSYQQVGCRESPAEYVAIPLGRVQEMYIEGTQPERGTQQVPDDNIHNHFSQQISNETSDFWQIPVYGDFVKEMKIKQNQVDNLISAGLSTKTELEMNLGSTPTSNLVDVSVQADLKRPVKDSSTSPLFWQHNHKLTQCDETEFNLDLSEEAHKDSLPNASAGNGGQNTSKQLVPYYQLRSKSAAKYTQEK